MSTTPSLTFLGAARTVTGSKTLIETSRSRVLVDCGMFQGERAWRRRNWDPLPIDPTSVDAVVVTHAHHDHCGYLPVLARAGFSGPILCSPATARLMAIVLRDAAHLQEQEAHWAQESGLSKHAEPRPLFDTPDADLALSLVEPLQRGVRRVIGDVGVGLRRGGHILGSRFAEVTVDDRRMVFSGDLGRPDHPLLLPPDPIGAADHVVVESTYGDRRHEDGGAAELGAVLARTLDRGGVALVPAFAVDRTPLLLHAIKGLIDDGSVPDVPVHVDSPMALRALEVYRDALTLPDTEFRPEVAGDARPFDAGHLRLVSAPEESARLNDPRHPCIIVSASGMAEGGRVLHHLEHQLPRSRNTVVLTGYQVAGTRGRALADGARQVKIHGRYVPVRAEVANLRGFSAHADADQVVAWLRGAGEPRCTFVVHGEETSAKALAGRLGDELGWTAVAPEYGERVAVG
jgi:metallo-beta-lactamase family protein